MNNQFNLYAHALTGEVSFSNYTGKCEDNLTPLQCYEDMYGRRIPFVSSESLVNSIRDNSKKLGMPINRNRVKNAKSITVDYQESPNPEKYFDDFIRGFMTVEKGAASSSERATLLVGKALGIIPGVEDGDFITKQLKQAPAKTINGGKEEAGMNLLEKEFFNGRFQYEWQIPNVNNIYKDKEKWLKALLESLYAIQPSGGQSSNPCSFTPRTIVFRLTKDICHGETFTIIDDNYIHSELISYLEDNQHKSVANEYYLSGEIVTHLIEKNKYDTLKSNGVNLEKWCEDCFKLIYKDIMKKMKS